MSGSVTPARRRYEESDEDLEEFEPSIDGEGSVRSNGSKRRRLDDDEDAEDNEDDDPAEVCRGEGEGCEKMDLKFLFRRSVAPFSPIPFDGRPRQEATQLICWPAYRIYQLINQARSSAWL